MEKLLKNWSWLLFSDVLQQIVGFVVVIFLARKLSPEGYGLFNVTISLATIFSIVSHLGMSNVIIRHISLSPESIKIFVKRILLPVRLVSFVVAILTFLAYNMIGDSAKNEIVFFIIIMILNMTLWNFSESIAFGNEVTKFSSILNISVSLLWLIFILLVPTELFSIYNVLLAHCLFHFAKAIIYTIIIYKKFYRINREVIKESILSYNSFVKMVIPYFLLLIIFTLSSQLPIQFLDANSSLNEVGYYSVGFKLMIPISIAVSTAFKAFFPTFAKLYAYDQESFQESLKKGMRIIVFLGTIIAIIASLFSRFWIPTLFGYSYENSVNVFNMLVWFSVLSIIDTLISNGFSAAFREKVLALLATIDFLILFPLLYISSYYDAHGVAITQLVTSIFFVTYHLIIFVNILKIKYDLKEVFILIGFYFSSLLVCIFLDNLILQILIVVLVFNISVLIKDSPILLAIYQIKNIISKIKTTIN